MTKLIAVFVCAALGSIAVWGCMGITRHLIIAIDKQGDAGTAIKQDAEAFNATLADVNRPCQTKVKAPSSTGEEAKDCGTIADINQTLHAIRGTFGQIERAAIHENKNLGMLDKQEATLFADLHSAAASAQTTLNASTGTLNAMTGTLGEAQTAIQHIGPILDSANAAIGQFTNTTAALTPRLERILDQSAPIMTNVQNATFNGNRILKDGADMTDELAKPKPLWMKLIPGAELGVKLYACAVDHVCVN